MLLIEFIATFALNEDKALKYLRDREVLECDNVPCPGNKNERCGKMIHEEILANGYRRWRCIAKKCRATRSIRAGNAFFHYRDSRGRLNLRIKQNEILLLVYLWLYANAYNYTSYADILCSNCGLEHLCANNLL